MLQIEHPGLLFNGQKAFSIFENVEKSDSPTPVSTLVFYQTDTEELPLLLKTTLDNLLSACRLDSQTTKCIAYRNTLVFPGIKAKNVLIFGDFPLGKNIQRLQKNVEYNLNDTKILRTESLENLEKVKGEKMKLWIALQKMFSLQ